MSQNPPDSAGFDCGDRHRRVAQRAADQRDAVHEVDRNHARNRAAVGQREPGGRSRVQRGIDRDVYGRSSGERSIGSADLEHVGSRRREGGCGDGLRRVVEHRWQRTTHRGPGNRQRGQRHGGVGDRTVQDGPILGQRDGLIRTRADHGRRVGRLVVPGHRDHVGYQRGAVHDGRGLHGIEAVAGETLIGDRGPPRRVSATDNRYYGRALFRLLAVIYATKAMTITGPANAG
jgi:hypothetical protein